MSSELEIIINNFLDKNPNLDYIINNNIIDKKELNANLEKMEKKELINFLSDILKIINQEKYEYSKKIKKIEELNLQVDSKSVINLLKYMYYEYNITKETFISICKKWLNINNYDNVLELLKREDVIVEDNSILSLSSKGIVLAVSLGFSLDDKDKEEYVFKVKKKINS